MCLLHTVILLSVTSCFIIILSIIIWTLLLTDPTSKMPSLASLLDLASLPAFLAGATLDLTSSQNISSYMPRFNNSADSPQPCRLSVALHGLQRRYKPRQSGHFIIGAIPTLQEHAFPVAYRILCLRFTLVVRLIASSRRKVFLTSDSAQRARLDTSGRLNLTRQGLSPC